MTVVRVLVASAEAESAPEGASLLLLERFLRMVMCRVLWDKLEAQGVWRNTVLETGTRVGVVERV